jgi:NADP oxidoreductase coenzyme F420-dependent
MSYAIIGFGKIGHALAKAFARKGIEVSVATTRDPQSFASAAAAIGPTIISKTLAEAVEADIVFLAVRFKSHKDVAKALPTWKGKTVIDVTTPVACLLRNWEDSLLRSSSHRLSLVDDWSRASTIWSLPSWTKIRPYTGAGESCSWRATMTLPQRRLARLRRISGSRRSNLAGFRKVGC